MTDPLSLAIIAFAFVTGGFVKGAAGLGLPVITVAVLTSVFGLKSAMALMVVPGVVTNAWQAASGEHAASVMKRIAIFHVPSLVTIWFGTGLLIVLDSGWLVLALGIILLFYSIVGLTGFSVQIPASKEKIVGPTFGALCGLTTGMTGVTSTPSVMYLNGLGMPRDMFIQSMGLHFFISYLVLTACLWYRDLLNLEVGLLSVACVVPALIGMKLGRAARSRMNEKAFKLTFYGVLLALGTYMIARAFLF